jgi:hypothetical protein
VPLLIAGGAATGRSLADGVLADVAPTLLELVGEPLFEGITGHSLLLVGEPLHEASEAVHEGSRAILPVPNDDGGR